MRSKVFPIFMMFCILFLDPGAVKLLSADDGIIISEWKACLAIEGCEVWVDDDFNAAITGFGVDHFNTIQDGINAVDDYGTVNVAAGTYTGTINLQGKPLILSGAGITETIIDASSLPGYAISNFADDTAINDLSLIGSDNYGFKISHVSNVRLENIKVEGSKKTGIDLNTVNGAILSNIEVTGTTSGFGLMILDSRNIGVTDVTTSANAWGGVSLQTKNAVSDNIAFSGAFDAQEQVPLLLENDPSTSPATDPPTYFEISSAGIPNKFGHVVYAFREGDNYRQWFYKETLEDAKALAQALMPDPLADPFTYSDMTVSTVAPADNYYVIGGLLIQDAIEAAGVGGTVTVAAGRYQENILVNKRISLIGQGSGVDGTVITQKAAGAGDSKIGVIQLDASGLPEAPILFKDLRVEPQGMAGFSVGRFTEKTGATVSYIRMENVKVKGTRPSACGEQERGLYVDLTSSLTHLTVVDSAFDELVYGWYLQKDVSADTSNVRYISVSDTSFSQNTHKGVYAEKLSDAEFDNCVFDGNGYSADAFVPCTYFQPWQAGVDINLKAGTYGNIFFTDCQVTNNGLGQAKEGVGLTVKARGTGDDASYADHPAVADGITINGGTFSGNERGIRIGEPGKQNTGPTNVVIQNAAITGNAQTYAGSDGSTYGELINASASPVLAVNNWWGDNDGPGAGGVSGHKISGSINADPWIRFVLEPDNSQIIFGSISALDVRAKLVKSDDGKIPAAINLLPQFAKVSFETDLGDLGAPVIIMDFIDGTAAATLIPPGTTGTANLTAQALDAAENPIAGATDAAQIEFTIGPLYRIVISPAEATVYAGSTQTYSAEAFDAYDNSLGDVTAETVFDIEAGAGGTWNENGFTAEQAGQWIVSGTFGGVSHTAALTVPVDGDWDGLPDSWEIEHFGDLSHDGLTDTDDDGFTDFEEYLADTDPNNSEEIPIAPPVVTRISPTKTANTETIEITIRGSNFTGTTSVSLELGGTTIGLETFTVAGPTEILATVPAGMAKGFYDIRVINADGRNRFVENKPRLSIYVPVNLSKFSQLDVANAIVEAGLTADSTPQEIIENLDPELVEAFELGALNADEGETVSIDANGGLSVTLTSGVAIDGAVPVAVTLTTTPQLETDVVIDAVIKAGTAITVLDQSGVGQPYSGNINPPAEVPITDAIAEQIANLGSDTERAVVFTMGSPDERLEISSPVFVMMDVRLPADAESPKIYYLETDGSLTLAGVAGTTDQGETIQRGGTVLLKTVDEVDGSITYTMGLLLDHMSTFVVASEPATTYKEANFTCFITSAGSGTALTSIVERLWVFSYINRHIDREGSALEDKFSSGKDER